MTDGYRHGDAERAGPAVDERGGHGMTPHLIPLCDGWALWHDVAVRSAGFPVSGLDAFGAGDEPGRLRAVASDPRFREAVTWQNRTAFETAIDKVALGSPTSGSKQRQREELVASYWQRYCAKNDTIGFFGPLAWGSMVEDGPALRVHGAGGDAARSVHFEAWCFEVLAESMGIALMVPLGPYPERDVRAQLERLDDAARRQWGLDALDRLESRRGAITAANGAAALGAALGDLDREFEELTARPATRRPGTMYAARTLVYVDCMRDVHVDIGPGLREELALTLPALLAGARWYCGGVNGAATRLIDAVVDSVGDGPLAPVLGRALTPLMGVPSEVPAVNAELQRRWAALLADSDVTTLVARAYEAFADYAPAWPMSVFHSPDVQVAAASAEAADAGEYLCVVGDFHPGANTLAQGLFATRHPDHERFLEAYSSDAGDAPFLIPPKTGQRMMARIMPAITRPQQVHVAATPGACMPEGYRVVDVADLLLEGGEIVARDGTALGSLATLLEFAIFVTGVRSYNPFPVEAHAPRITLSRTVLRRETWQVAAADAPLRPEGAAEWARSRGMPRRVFLLSPLEDKPVLVDFESRVLTAIACRLLRRAAAERPAGIVRFTEMLPEPADCWLADADGNRYTSELRLVAVDLARRAGTPT